MNDKYSKDADYKVIAVIVGGLYSVESQQYIKTISEVGKKYNHKWIFFATRTDLFYGNVNDKLEQNVFELIDVSRFDAIVILTETFKGKNLYGDLIKKSKDVGVPIFAVDRRIEGCISVMFDYKDAFRRVVRHMIEDHGYREVNFMNGRRNDVYSDERLEVFKEVLAENDIEFDPRRVYYGEFWEEPTIREMHRMEEEWNKMPQAIICANDAMAIVVNEYLKQRGYRIPQDIATSGFDGLMIGQYCTPRLTTGYHDIEELINQVCKCVNDIKNVKTDEEYMFSHSIFVGESCGCDGDKPNDIGAEMVNMKTELYREIEFQNSMNEMIPVLTYNSSFETAIKDIIERIKPINYKKMWICSNMADSSEPSTYCFRQSKWEQMGNRSENIYSDYLWVLESKGEGETILIDEGCKVKRSDIVPDINSVFEENDMLLVNSIHLSDYTTGYVAIAFDIKNLWVTAYSTFLTNLCYIIELHKTQAKLLHAYLFDPLTGLYNRVGFFDQMNKVLEQYTSGKLALISMDLDGLKHINDTYGHAMGDEAIATLGRIIGENSARWLSTRLGGDEFLVVVFDENADDIANCIVNKILKGVTQYNITENKCYTVEVSIGLYVDEIEGKSFDIFMKKADDLMYKNKSQHKNRRRD